MLLKVMVLTLVATTAQAFAGDIPGQVTEAQVWELSNSQYEMIVSEARKKGWAFPADQVRRGYTRYHDELRLRLIDSGYEIVSDYTTLQWQF